MAGVSTSDGSGLKFFDLSWVRSIFCGLGQTVLIWKNSPKNVKFFNFIPSDKKNPFGSGQKVPRSKAGQAFIYCKSKVSSGRVRSGPISSFNSLDRVVIG